MLIQPAHDAEIDPSCVLLRCHDQARNRRRAYSLIYATFIETFSSPHGLGIERRFSASDTGCSTPPAEGIVWRSDSGRAQPAALSANRHSPPRGRSGTGSYPDRVAARIAKVAFPVHVNRPVRKRCPTKTTFDFVVSMFTLCTVSDRSHRCGNVDASSRQRESDISGTREERRCPVCNGMAGSSQPASECFGLRLQSESLYRLDNPASGISTSVPWRGLCYRSYRGFGGDMYRGTATALVDRIASR